MNFLDDQVGSCLVCQKLTTNYDPDIGLFACEGEHYQELLESFGYGWTYSS